MYSVEQALLSRSNHVFCLSPAEIRADPEAFSKILRILSHSVDTDEPAYSLFNKSVAISLLH
jgi:hypothetical protein